MQRFCALNRSCSRARLEWRGARRRLEGRAGTFSHQNVNNFLPTLLASPGDLIQRHPGLRNPLQKAFFLVVFFPPESSSPWIFNIYGFAHHCENRRGCRRWQRHPVIPQTSSTVHPMMVILKLLISVPSINPGYFYAGKMDFDFSENLNVTQTGY